MSQNYQLFWTKTYLRNDTNQNMADLRLLVHLKFHFEKRYPHRRSHGENWTHFAKSAVQFRYPINEPTAMKVYINNLARLQDKQAWKNTRTVHPIFYRTEKSKWNLNLLHRLLRSICKYNREPTTRQNQSSANSHQDNSGPVVQRKLTKSNNLQMPVLVHSQ